MPNQSNDNQRDSYRDNAINPTIRTANVPPRVLLVKHNLQENNGIEIFPSAHNGTLSPVAQQTRNGTE